MFSLMDAAATVAAEPETGLHWYHGVLAGAVGLAAWGPTLRGIVKDWLARKKGTPHASEIQALRDDLAIVKGVVLDLTARVKDHGEDRDRHAKEMLDAVQRLSDSVGAGLSRIQSTLDYLRGRFSRPGDSGR